MGLAQMHRRIQPTHCGLCPIQAHVAAKQIGQGCATTWHARAGASSADIPEPHEAPLPANSGNGSALEHHSSHGGREFGCSWFEKLREQLPCQKPG